MSNPYYTHATYPGPNAPGSSAALRAELELITVGFDKLPTLAGNAGRVVRVNDAGTALEAVAVVPALEVIDSTFVIQDNGDPAKKLQFQLSSISTGATRTVTIPDANLTLVGLDTIQTLTNKTLTAPVINTPTLAGGTIDNTVIGGTTAAAGTFTSMTANSATVGGSAVVTLAATQTLTNKTISGGSITGAAITGLPTPTADGDAANKGYVDAVAQSLDIKGSVRVATTANITLSGTQTIDGVSVIVGDRVLVKDQSTQSQNGIYVAAAGAWSRSSDADAWAELPGAFFFVEEGSVNDNSGWVCTVSAGGTLGVTAVTFEQFSGAGQITAGAGLTKTGNTLNIGTASSARIVVNPDTIDLATTGVSAGTYRSVTVDVYGRVTAGTSPTTLAGYGITDAYTKTYIDTLYGSTASAAASAADALTYKNSAETAANTATTQAGIATTQASSASSSATTATTQAGIATSAATAAAASYDSFDDRYLGAKSTPPLVDNDGNPLIVGALYFDTTGNLMKVYTGAAWVNAGSSVNGTSSRQTYTATGGQTTFAMVYDVGYVDVYLNGLKLQAGSEFTATDGTSVVLASGATAGDIVDLVAYGTFTLANFYSKTESDARYLQLTGGTLTGPTALSVNSSSDALRITQTGSGNALYIEDVAADATPFVVSSTGVVGIGTTTPDNVTSAGIALVSNNGFFPQIIQRNKSNDTTASYLVFDKDRAGSIVQNGDALGAMVWRSFDGTNYLQSAAIIGYSGGTPGTNDVPGYLSFLTTPDGASSPIERMSINNAGNVGIGTSSPGAKLNVAGAAGTSVNTILANGTTTGANFWRLTNTGGDGVLGVESSSPGSIVSSSSAYATVLYTVGATSLQLGTNSSIKATLDSAGNLGLGVTPSSAPAGSFFVRRSISGTAINPFSLYHNATLNSGETADVYINNGFASRYYQNNGAHFWQTAPSGTAGNAISFTQAMTLDASANLSVGTTAIASSGQSNSLTTGAALAVKGILQNHTTAALVLDYNSNRSTLRAYGATAGSGLICFNVGGGNNSADFEAARIDSIGNLLVGGTGANARLYSQGMTSSGYAVGAQTTGAGAGLYGGWSGSTVVYTVFGNGNVVNTNNSYGAISDVKMKENVTDATPKLEKLNQVRIVNFNIIGQEQKQIGVIAQELEQIFPGMVEESPDRDDEGNDLGTTTKSVKYSVFVPMLIKAIQEQQAIIEQLKARLDAANL